MNEKEIINAVGIESVIQLKKDAGVQALTGYELFVRHQALQENYTVEDISSLVLQYQQTLTRTDGKTDVYYLG